MDPKDNERTYLEEVTEFGLNNNELKAAIDKIASKQPRIILTEDEKDDIKNLPYKEHLKKLAEKQWKLGLIEGKPESEIKCIRFENGSKLYFTNDNNDQCKGTDTRIFDEWQHFY